MTSNSLDKAKQYEEKEGKDIFEAERPAFHLTPRVGWMNDPNGFSYYKGKYHMFYQYHPYSANWGPMHWGHAISDDLLHWERLPVALAPDAEYDKAGCFSGSAIELEDGRHLLMYTGVAKEIQENGEERDVQRQCIAIGDGITYEKIANNPVLTEKELPPNASRFDFRDPKIWREKNGTFYCAVGGCDKDKDGRIFLYRSTDAQKWEFEKELLVNNKRLGKMWECPDYFELDGRQVLIVSPQEVEAKAYECLSGNISVAFIGRDEAGFEEESCQILDYGIDFYAPQTVKSPDGRRIMIGWMQNWDTNTFYRSDFKWFGQLSVPRELSIKNGRILQKPIRELEELYKNMVLYNEVEFSGLHKLSGIFGRVLDMEVEIRPVNSDEIYHDFKIYFAQNEDAYSSISYSTLESTVEVDRTYSGTRTATMHQRKCKVLCDRGTIKFRIILDKYSAEIFVNDGQQVLSMTFYTDMTADGISFYADKNVVMNVIKYDLEDNVKDLLRLGV